MASVEEILSARFRSWERRTRGWIVHPHPVAPEPVFVPFPPPGADAFQEIDDGRRPTVVSALWRSLWTRRATTKPDVVEPVEPEPEAAQRGGLVELPLFMSADFSAKSNELTAFLHSLANCREPLAFELLGTAERVTAQLVAGRVDAAYCRQQLRAYFPDLVTVPAADGLARVWNAAGEEAGVVEFGLGVECVLPLATPGHDPHVAFVSLLSELAEGECALLQVIWQAVENEWAESLVASVTDARGGAFFVNAPELAGAAKQKTAQPLHAVVLRVAARTESFERTWELLRAFAIALKAFQHPEGNAFVPLRNDDYPFEAHLDDVLARRSRRTGMILNAAELLALAHPPSPAVRSPKFQRQLKRTKAAPVLRGEGLCLGVNEHAGETRTVIVPRAERRRHMHLIGASGTGKTTLLYNLIRQDLASGEGFAVLDPHGDLIDAVLGAVPPERVQDVVLLDPGDEEYSVGFNLLSAQSDLERNVLASDLVSVFQRLSTSWGDQMSVVLGNAIRAFLDSERGGSLADLRRFLVEPAFREKFLGTVRDPELVYYWRKGFSQLAGNKSLGPVLTRLETFLGPRPIRHLVAQRANRLDFAHIMDSGKILLAKLSHGAIGRENAALLGSLLMAKFQQVAMGRQAQAEAARRDFWVYVDEFPNFMTASLAEILTGARKYRLGLVLAHQEMRQAQRNEEVAAALLANPYARVCFRVGENDARTLAAGFSTFETKDLLNLGTGEAVVRLERSDWDFNLRVLPPDFPAPDEAKARRAEVVAASRARYATPRAEVEAALREAISATPSELVVKQPVVASRPVEETKPATIGEPAVSQPVAPLAPALQSCAREVEATANPPLPYALPVVTRRDEVAASEPGRGGHQHKEIQRRLKAEAEAMGFRAEIEHVILDGAGSVDLALSRGGLAVACEIAITTTLDHEVGNVLKCLKAGYPWVAVVSVSEERLARLGEAVRNSLGSEATACVKFFLPERFVEWLRDLPAPPEPEPPGETKVLGYRVKKKYPTLTPEERQAREQAAIGALAELMQGRPKKISPPKP